MPVINARFVIVMSQSILKNSRGSVNPEASSILFDVSSRSTAMVHSVRLNSQRRFVSAGRILAACAAAVGLLLGMSLPHTPEAPRWLIAATIAFSVLAAYRPAAAFLILTAAAPITGFLCSYFGLAIVWTEPLVVAGLTGWFLRAALGFDACAAPARPRRAWALLVTLVAASLTVELAVEQIYTLGFAWPILRFLRADYFVDRGAYPSIAAALLLLEGLALFAWTSNAAADDRRWRQVAAMTAFGGAMAAVLNVSRFLEIVLRTGLPLSVWFERSSTLRVNALHADVNAAASYFVLILALHAGLAHARRRQSLVWLSAGVFVAAALWLTGSRTAIVVAALIGWTVLVNVAVRGKAGGVRAFAGLAAVILLIAAAGLFHLYPTKFAGTPAVEALRVRRDMALTSLRMTRTEPIFGVGVGRFYARSPEFMPEIVAAEYAHENAHNNFLQVLAELGIVGLAAFVWLLIAVLWRPRNRTGGVDQTQSVLSGLRIGIVGFLLTCLLGHPLLVREVAYPFWIALGLVAARTSGTQAFDAIGRRGWGRRMMLGAMLVIVTTLPVRAIHQRQNADLEEFASGVSAWERDAAGVWVRRLSASSTFYVLGAAPLVEIPLRLTDVPMETAVLVLLDGKPANRITLTDREWRSLRLVLPRDRASRFRRIDLEVERPSSTLVMGRLRYPGWK